MMDSLTTTRDGLIGALDAAVVSMRSRATRSVSTVIKAGAREFLSDPTALHRLAPSLEVCERRIASMRALRGHYAFDVNRLIALKQARLALRVLRRARVVARAA